MNWKNDITRILGIQYPIIQAPMFGVGTPAMVAAAEKAGTLGSLPLGDLTYEKCVDIIRATKAITTQPFAANIFVYDTPALTDELKHQYKTTRSFLEQLAAQHGLEVTLPDIESIKVAGYREQVDALIAENCRIVSFTFGNLDAESVRRLKQNGACLIGTCTTIEEALILEQSGIDLICVQGIEAGGHRGTFTPGDIPSIGGMSLLSQVFDKVKRPLIYAGGLYDAKTILAARTLGAQGFQIGSMLLGSTESALQDFEKQRLRQAQERDIILTNSFSGRYARGLRNIYTAAVDNTPHILPYPYQNKLTGPLRTAAKAKQNAGFVSIWAGQSLNGYPAISTTDILQQLIHQLNQSPV